MASVDTRIKREARLFARDMQEMAERHAEVAVLNRRELQQKLRDRLERVTSLVNDEIANMAGRCVAQNGGEISHFERAGWLKGKTFDATYDDYGPDEKRARTRQRIESLLQLCGGDEKLLVTVYASALNRYFPIMGRTWTWGPKLIEVEAQAESKSKARLTIQHDFKRLSTPRRKAAVVA